MINSMEVNKKLSVAERMLEQERISSITLIDRDKLKDFLYTNAYTPIGKKMIGSVEKETQLIEEIAEVLKLCGYIFMNEGVNYYKKLAPRDNAHLMKQATKKLLFLNSVCKNTMGNGGFIKVKIERDNRESQLNLINAFEWCVRHYEENLE